MDIVSLLSDTRGETSRVIVMKAVTCSMFCVWRLFSSGVVLRACDGPPGEHSGKRRVLLINGTPAEPTCRELDLDDPSRRPRRAKCITGRVALRRLTQAGAGADKRSDVLMFSCNRLGSEMGESAPISSRVVKRRVVSELVWG